MVGHKILDLVIMVRVHAGQWFDAPSLRSGLLTIVVSAEWVRALS